MRNHEGFILKNSSSNSLSTETYSFVYTLRKKYICFLKGIKEIIVNATEIICYRLNYASGHRNGKF